MSKIDRPPPELVLGTRLNSRVPEADQKRQRAEVEEILRRLVAQPGVILADEVGMGKTFVALAIAYCYAVLSARGPVIVMAPANLIDKWTQDLHTFCDLYLDNRRAVDRDRATRKELTDATAVRYGVARHSVDLMKLLDDSPRERCHLIFLAQGAMSRRQTDKWVRLALIAEALRRHGRGKASRLIQVKRQIHRFLGELLGALGEERAHEQGEELWQELLRIDPAAWKDTYNRAVRNDQKKLGDDPVPKAVVRTLPRVDLKTLAQKLEEMPIRARGGEARVSERLDAIRVALRAAEEELWKDLLAQARWRSPLLVMDEAHHLKNPGTALARQFRSDLENVLRTGDGAMAKAFDRMLFLTATPFQLGHHELVRVLERFKDVRWDGQLGGREAFPRRMDALSECLNESQRSAIRLQQSWSRLTSDDCDGDRDAWWNRLLHLPRETMNKRQAAVVDAYHAGKCSHDAAQQALQPWIVRHNKGDYWGGTDPPIRRRRRMDGAAIVGGDRSSGLCIPPQQLLPFFLAARSAVNPRQDLLGEALSSSFEAFRFTRENHDPGKDEQEELVATAALAHSRWYLHEFDEALKDCSGSMHPKIDATVRRTVDLWETGEKVLVFAFYRHTCRALRVHISREIERRIIVYAQRRFQDSGQSRTPEEIKRTLDRIQDNYFDRSESAERSASPGRRAIDAALEEILRSHAAVCDKAQILPEQLADLRDVMRSFLRTQTTLVRCFPFVEVDDIDAPEAVAKTMDHRDGSGVSLRRKFDGFIEFLCVGCSSPEERDWYLEAAGRTRTGGIGVKLDDDDDTDEKSGQGTLPNVRVAMGATRRDTRVRLMRAFNTPFLPDILVCSQVMGEGVDLQRFCRHVIHHDLDWNPSTIEQRTGRIDRLGCKAENRHPIDIYLPYLAGTADERQYRVMLDRERWFRIVMGQDEVARLITPDSDGIIPLPDAISTALSFRLDSLSV
ncbi:MAG: DEAD/DEAH box helicase [Pirellulaceae bacterium]|nr:DEAD/DEAH box helicase [Pirellulaceae bacterium]